MLRTGAFSEHGIVCVQPFDPYLRINRVVGAEHNTATDAAGDESVPAVFLPAKISEPALKRFEQCNVAAYEQTIGGAVSKEG